MIDDCWSWQVTILGESAGSCSVFLQTVSVFLANSIFLYFVVVEIFHSAIYWCFNCQWSKFLFQPLNTGLIHRVIAQSGGNLGPGTITKQPHPSDNHTQTTSIIAPQWQSNTNIAGLGNNPKSQERAFQLGETLANLLGCQVKLLKLVKFTFSLLGCQVKLLDLIKFTFALFISGRTWYLALLPPGDWRRIRHFGCHGLWTLSQYRQGLANWPYVLTGAKVEIKWKPDKKDLGDDAFLPLPPREILESGQVGHSNKR